MMNDNKRPIKSSEKNVVKIFKTDNEDKNAENGTIHGFIWWFFRTISLKLKQRTINKLDKKYTWNQSIHNATVHVLPKNVIIFVISYFNGSSHANPNKRRYTHQKRIVFNEATNHS